MNNDMDAPNTADDFATRDDLNWKVEAVMEHVNERDGFHTARVDDLEATVVTLRQLVQQRLPVQDAGPPSPLPSTRPLDQWPVTGE